MYSIVMLSAMSATADVTPAPAPAPAVAYAPVSYGCCGAVLASCSGSAYYGSSCSGSAYYGSSCYGSSCHGGGHFGKRLGGFLGGRSSCHGCSGYSCSGYNCFSSGYAYSPAGYGSCYGSGYGCAGAYNYGSSWGPPIGMPPYTLHGYNSGAAAYGPGFPVVPGISYTDPHAVYGSTYTPNQPPVVTVPAAPMPKPSSDASPMSANLKFSLPAEAKLFVDGKPAPGTGTERSFYTPPLAAGQKFFYDVKAEMTVDGKLVVEEKKVIVEAGANLTETFPKLVAAARAGTTIAGK